MSPSGKKPAPIPTPPGRPNVPQTPAKAQVNPRLQPDNRWQRTKRYGWDSR